MENNIVFLSGQKVNLRPYDKEKDLKNCLRWVSDPEIRRYFPTFMQFPHTLKTEADELEPLTSGTGNCFLIIETLDAKSIGTIGLFSIDWVNRTAETGTLIGKKEYQNKGYGADAKMILLNYAFNSLNLRKITATVLSDNKKSLSYNKKCGYQSEGIRKKQSFRNGKYHDEILIAVFKEDFQKIWTKYQRQK